ncbi:protein kinase family protein [Streptomyces sp. NPDC020192]|uniref:protein kinase family protein n=1 Tax=Streptomyces sp. NPDC020192 TaxID=3365066 RepID=UPI0037A44C2B
MASSSRLTAHTRIANRLNRLTDEKVAKLLAAAEPLGTGIGGRSARLLVAGRPVFVKRVPLTDLERLPGNERSTANLFGVSPYCHYGIGGPGFTAWRELAAQRTTTRWAPAGRFPGVPLPHHWRVLPDEPRHLPAELADMQRTVAYWGGGAQVRRRIEALRTASASLALFLEHVPYTVHDWFEGELRTDRRTPPVRHRRRPRSRLRVRLAGAERVFAVRHQDYDRAYTALLPGEEFVRSCAAGARPEGIPRTAAALLSPLSWGTSSGHWSWAELTPYLDQRCTVPAPVPGSCRSGGQPTSTPASRYSTVPRSRARRAQRRRS